MNLIAYLLPFRSFPLYSPLILVMVMFWKYCLTSDQDSRTKTKDLEKHLWGISLIIFFSRSLGSLIWRLSPRIDFQYEVPDLFERFSSSDERSVDVSLYSVQEKFTRLAVAGHCTVLIKPPNEYEHFVRLYGRTFLVINYLSMTNHFESTWIRFLGHIYPPTNPSRIEIHEFLYLLVLSSL